MELNRNYKIILVGAGNVSSHLGNAFIQAGSEIVQVYSRTLKSASYLSEKFNCPGTNHLIEIKPTADFYIFSVSDDALEEVLPGFPHKNAFFIHTSGSLPLNIFKRFTDNFGVVYPLQTFSKHRDIDMTKVPFFVEANSDKNLEKVIQLTSMISGIIHPLDSGKRRILHLAAVFGCNFVNHMYAIAEDILEKQDLPFEFLKPLIEETASKIMSLKPKEAQTGPAIRNDAKTMDNHTRMLSGLPQYQKIYTFVSESIFRFYSNDINLKNERGK